MLDAEQRDQVGVATRLRDDSRACVDKDDGKVGRRAAGYHVARVLFVPRRVGNDEFPLVGREVAVCHVDGDALLALCLQSVEQQGVVYVVAGIAHALAVPLQRVELVFVDFLAVKQQPAYQGRLAVIDRACGEKTEKVLLLVPPKELFN